MPIRLIARRVAALAAAATLLSACTAAAHDGPHGGAMLRSALGSDALRGAATFQAAAVPSGFTETTVWSGLTTRSPSASPPTAGCSCSSKAA